MRGHFRYKHSHEGEPRDYNTEYFIHYYLTFKLEQFTFHVVAKMASHAIFQYNILAIDDTHNTWTNICVKMIIIRLIGPRDEKIQNPEEIRLKGPRQR